MRNALIVFLSIVQFVSCSTGTVNKDNLPAASKETLLSFSVIDNDSAYIVDYRYEKKAMKDTGFSFRYANDADSFTLFLDTSRRMYTGKFGKGGIINLDLEKMNYYIINGTGFKVLKLVGDKEVTDGAFSLFLSPDFGLLISKSNTWRSAKVRCLDTSSSNIQLMALLYRIQTDSAFFTSPVPDLDKKMKAPRVE